MYMELSQTHCGPTLLSNSRHRDRCASPCCYLGRRNRNRRHIDRSVLSLEKNLQNSVSGIGSGDCNFGPGLWFLPVDVVGEILLEHGHERDVPR